MRILFPLVLCVIGAACLWWAYVEPGNQVLPAMAGAALLGQNLRNLQEELEN